MGEKNLLQQIRSEYYAVNPAMTLTDAAAVNEFCAYAERWLINAGIIGLGYSADGMSLRLKTGDEIPFFAAQPPDAILTAAVNITGNSTGLKTSTGERPLDVAITGS